MGRPRHDARGAAGRAASRERPPLPAGGTLVAVEVGGLAAPATTRVESVDGWQLTVVAPTRRSGQAVAVAPATPVAVEWGDQAGWWRAATSVAGIDQDVVTVWRLATERVERWQRRRAFRLETVVPVVLRAAGRSLETATRDLSEGGLRCRVPAELAPSDGELLAVDLRLPGEHGGQLDGVPARVVRVEWDHTPYAELGLALQPGEQPELSEVVERLRRYVFEEQLEQRRRA